MKKKSYTAPQSEVIAIDTIMPIAASGEVNDSEDNGKVEIILPDGGNTVDQGVLMSLDDPHLWD
ncbi:hypothetical protein I6E49_06345 [Prevotella stercorea]|uniref:hypothetical protein n=1 Tax=Leyella stercorea TaxID=363265 RepID=UPI001F23F388|nr:hypothetical protein [Leyella stercorea]MCF2644923.1 hypothetical protein [Leyella stercorea]